MIRKSKAMAAGSWNTTVNMMDNPYCTELAILGFQFSCTVGQSGKSNWTRVTGQFKAAAREANGRVLRLTERIQYVHVYLLAKIEHSTNFSRLKGARQTDRNGNSMVHLEGNDIPRPSVHPKTRKRGRRTIKTRYRG